MLVVSYTLIGRRELKSDITNIFSTVLSRSNIDIMQKRRFITSIIDIIWFSVIFLITPVVILSIRMWWLERENEN